MKAYKSGIEVKWEDMSIEKIQEISDEYAKERNKVRKARDEKAISCGFFAGFLNAMALIQQRISTNIENLEKEIEKTEEPKDKDMLIGAHDFLVEFYDENTRVFRREEDKQAN